MKKSAKLILVAMLLIGGAISFRLVIHATSLPFGNLFETGFSGYTSDEKEVLTPDYISSQRIRIAAGEKVWFGPCNPAQYFQLVGYNANGEPVTGKIRGKQLTVEDTFGNGMVIYSYQAAGDVAEICLSAPASVAPVYVVSKEKVTCLNWEAYWKVSGVETEDYVGKSNYQEVNKGDKLYFGAITAEDAMASRTYDKDGNAIGTIQKADLRMVDSFGGAYSIYCYTVSDEAVKFIRVAYDTQYEQYYTCIRKNAGDTTSDADMIADFITTFGIPRPAETTVEALSGKSALFVGDSITYGARDRANIYSCGSWAGRIGYYCNMNVTNNGVSGACITTARVESHSPAHYIYNNLVKAKDSKFDYVIMHGLFNDASIPTVEAGTPKGRENFDPSEADASKFADALELLFYTAEQQHPEATLGYIVNFHTDRDVDESTFANLAIQICEDWGIQYLDLYNRPGFSVEFDDGLHPSSAGYDSMYTIVADWMASLQ